MQEFVIPKVYLKRTIETSLTLGGFEGGYSPPTHHLEKPSLTKAVLGGLHFRNRLFDN